MKRTLLAIVAGALVTVLGYFFLASVILPGGADSQLPSDVVSDNAGPDSEITPQMRAAVLLQERRMRELKCAPIEAHVQELIDTSRDCEKDSDCAVVKLGCPFFCVGAYNTSAESEIKEEEKSYQERCHSCIYTCPSPLYEWHAVCQNNKCQVVDRPAFRMQPSPSN